MNREEVKQHMSVAIAPEEAPDAGDFGSGLSARIQAGPFQIEHRHVAGPNPHAAAGEADGHTAVNVR